ncbi:Hypothetical protein BP5553_00828 [Venustampulla echinocandica]|uniref:SWIRM domain-containing protein n=1 Tax=Venustampulla echinocandica TaxID=2656787 RepID=A0A370TZ91_9HELO|nr:Hypothetical protein BP5553_00828 [Venustampulla echinocandica]RDL40849.1 Hypothetical protein BP5553_00828 [Venustampulla echinocandica]
MADKTLPNRPTLQPSTPFDDSSSTAIHIHSLAAPSTSSTSRPHTYPSTSINAIVSGINRPATERKNPMDIQASLMSPPEAIPHDSFSPTSSRPSNDSKMKSSYLAPAARFQPPLSPPVSPESKSTTPDSPASVVRDPILFPSPDTQTTPSSQPPLFYDETLAQRVVDEHVRAREESFFRVREVSPPRDAEYREVLEFKSQVAKIFSNNPRLWAAREREYLKEDSALRLGGRRWAAIAPASNSHRKPARPPGARTASNGGVGKSGPLSRQSKTPKSYDNRGVTPDGHKKVTNREDKDFNALPDYCPPLTSLPNKPNSLKIDWKGTPIDLRGDPHAHLLHPDEIYLAANLRLDCATYLTSKRRIFIKRIEALKIGKEFRKTDAQQACKIDVNKASKLWTAFDKVHWLDPRWVEKYL